MFHRKDWAEFKMEEQRFALQKVKTEQVGQNGAVVYFLAKPIEHNIKRLKGFGVKLSGSIEIRPYGKFARFKDPEGNIFGLYEPPLK